MFSTVVTGQLAADSEKNPLDLIDPITRYTKENPKIDQLSFWNEEIVMEIVGQDLPDTAFYAASLAKTLAENAKNELRLTGDPEIWFLPKQTISNESNLVIIFQDLTTGNRTAKQVLSIEDIDLDITSSGSSVHLAIDRGLTRVGPGCFGNWSATQNNVITATVQIIDSNLSKHDQKKCIESVMLASFGVRSAFTTLTFSDVPGIPDHMVFTDTTEATLLVRLSAFCRNELNTTSISCPRSIIETLYDLHGNLFTNQ